VNWRRAFIGIGLVLPVIALLGYGLTRNPGEIPSPLPGKAAPDFALTVFAPGEGATSLPVGDTVRLSSYRGNVIVLNFWASWCLQCRDEHEGLSAVATAYADRGVKFFGVLYNDFPGRGVRWIEEMRGQSYPSLQDPRTRTAIDYGLYGVPETFLVTREGKVAYKHIGPIGQRLLVQKLDSLLRDSIAPE
jgi:cytochrome c biogenesis protein CcmG/thiol:disulfide interchange protein DsbE